MYQHLLHFLNRLLLHNETKLFQILLFFFVNPTVQTTTVALPFNI